MQTRYQVYQCLAESVIRYGITIYKANETKKHRLYSTTIHRQHFLPRCNKTMGSAPLYVHRLNYQENENKYDSLQNIQEHSAGTRLHDIKATEVMNELQMLHFHQICSYIILTTRYYDTEYKSPVKKDRLLRQTERYYIPRVFTYYGKRKREYYVPFLFITLLWN